MPLVYVFAAMKIEARPLERMVGRQAGLSSATHLAEGKIGNNQIALFLTGIGPRRAGECAKAALGSISPLAPQLGARPDAALVIGTCGSLSPSLPENTIVTYVSCLSTDSSQTPLACSARLNASVGRLLQSKGLDCEQVIGITSARAATHLDQRLALAQSGATVIDMESYEIVATANRAQVPVSVLRVVSDSLDRKMPNFDRALKPDGDFALLKALRIAVGSPLRTFKTIAASRRAIGHLESALEVILSAACFVPIEGP